MTVRGPEFGLAAVFAAIAVLAGADVLADLGSGTEAVHLVLESCLALAGLTGFAVIARKLVAEGRRAQELEGRAADAERSLVETRQEADRWRREAADLLSGLGAAIDLQLDQWGLSAAEKEIALLLLKGLSHKEIADVRSVAEATVRQQARALYRKAGLQGRHDLAAFFLEDLLAPRTRSPGAPPV